LYKITETDSPEAMEIWVVKAVSTSGWLRIALSYLKNAIPNDVYAELNGI